MAKFEHAWLGLPHLVCRGAEKNFEAFASRLEDDGEPTVDKAFFEAAVARAILWRSTERLFDSLDLEGYRAQSVAYGLAWLAEASGRRIDLTKLWRSQNLPDEIAAAMLTVVGEAHRFLTSRTGNIGEACKKPETWAEFRDQKIKLDKRWLAGLVETPSTHYPASKPKPEAEASKKELESTTAEYWFALSKWSKDRGFLEGWERSLAYSLGRLKANGSTPSDKQAVQGARIMARAHDLGFIHTD